MADNKNDLPFNDDNVNLFIERFSTGHWARQGELNARKRSTSYIPGDKCHLSPTLVRQHLSKEITLASYAITRSNTCRFLVIDFDVETAIAQENMRASGTSKAYEEAEKAIKQKITETIEKMVSYLRISRDQLLIEQSGSKGFHLWMFFSEELPAHDVYRLRGVLRKELDLVQYEIYPEQESGSDSNPGSLIKLPLGVNRKTFKRCFFLDDNFTPDPRGQWIALENTQLVTPSQVSAILKLQNTEANQIENSDEADLSKIGSLSLMLSSCKALQVIEEKALNANPDDGFVNLTHDERLFIATIYGRFGVSGEAKIHELLSKTDNYDAEKTQKTLDSLKASRIKPMCCATAIDKGICSCIGGCDNIKRAHGKSPIKLAGFSANKKMKGDEYLKIKLGEIEDPILCGKKITVDFSVNTLIGSPYFSPKKIAFKPCSKSCCEKYDECLCDDRDNVKVINLTSTDKLHIQVYGVDDSKAMSLLKARVEGCDRKNRLVKEPKSEEYTVQPFICSNIIQTLVEAENDAKVSAVDENGEQHALVAKEMKDYAAFCLSNELETSKTYRGKGIVLPNPQNQSITVLFSEVEPLNSPMDSFIVDDSNREGFEVFKKMTVNEKVSDVADNIVFVKGREEVIKSILLTFFSTIEFEFNKTLLTKGWVDTLMVGDSGQAKSIMVERLIGYIGLGYLASSNCSVPGLIGACDTSQKKAYINWGMFPRANKSLLFMDEVQNLPYEVHSQLRIVRQSGVARVDKMIKGSHEAKTRLIAAANPLPKERTMSEFKYGALSLESLPMGKGEIRRYDIALFLNAADNDRKAINSLNTGKDPVMTREMIRNAVLWAWSRKKEQIILSEEVTKAILESATKLSSIYDVDSVPICNTADMREKIARLTVAHAALSMKTDDYVYLKPDVDDVKAVANLLHTIYSHPSVRLNELCRDRKKAVDLDDNQFTEIVAYLGKDDYSKMLEVMEGFLEISSAIRVSDLGGYVGATMTDMNKIITVLNRYNMISMEGSGAYSAKPKLTKFLNRYRALLEKGGGIEKEDAIPI